MTDTVPSKNHTRLVQHLRALGVAETIIARLPVDTRPVEKRGGRPRREPVTLSQEEYGAQLLRDRAAAEARREDNERKKRLAQCKRWDREHEATLRDLYNRGLRLRPTR